MAWRKHYVIYIWRTRGNFIIQHITIMKGYIYKYMFQNGKIYIGQTRQNISVRHREHLSPSTGPLNPKFWQAYQELGEPILEIIKEVEENNYLDLTNALNKTGCKIEDGFTDILRFRVRYFMLDRSGRWGPTFASGRL